MHAMCPSFPVMDLISFQVKDFVMTTKVPPEKAQCFGNKFWWCFKVHELLVDELAKDAR